MPGGTQAHQRGVTLAKPQIAARLPRIEASRLRNHKMEVVAAVLGQALVAKDNTGAEHSSNDPQAFENGRERGAKPRPGPRFKIDVRHEPRVPLAPLTNRITLRGHVGRTPANHEASQSGLAWYHTHGVCAIRALAVSTRRFAAVQDWRPDTC
jgi:hypothetical protein